MRRAHGCTAQATSTASYSVMACASSTMESDKIMATGGRGRRKVEGRAGRAREDAGLGMGGGLLLLLLLLLLLCCCSGGAGLEASRCRGTGLSSAETEARASRLATLPPGDKSWDEP